MGTGILNKSIPTPNSTRARSQSANRSNPESDTTAGRERRRQHAGPG